MAEGDLIVEHYHLELRGLLMGPGTRFHWSGPWSGFGHVVKSYDVDLEGADGVYPARDALAAKLLSFPIGWGGSDAADAMTDFSELLEAWRPASTGGELLELHGSLPGWEHFFVVGRPRGLVEDLSKLKSGEGSALCSFLATDPTIYYPAGSGS